MCSSISMREIASAPPLAVLPAAHEKRKANAATPAVLVMTHPRAFMTVPPDDGNESTAGPEARVGNISRGGRDVPGPGRGAETARREYVLALWEERVRKEIPAAAAAGEDHPIPPLPSSPRVHRRYASPPSAERGPM